MIHLRSLLIALALLAASSALAAEPKGTAADVARLLVPREAWSAGVQQLSKNVQARLQSHYPGATLQYPAEFEKKVRTEVEGVIPYDEVIATNAKELSAAYTEPELKEMLAFYRTPTGQKALKAMPAVSEKAARATQARVDEKMPALMQRLGQFAKKQ